MFTSCWNIYFKFTIYTYRTMDETGKKLLQDELKYLWAEHHDLSHEKNDQK